jgi:lipopolysaccharide export system protein LptA
MPRPPGLTRNTPRPGAGRVLALAAALAATPALAREGDRQQPATIEADRAEIDQAAGVSHYYGEVVFEQGSLRITGARLSIRAPDGVVRRAEAQGEPARVRQETDAGRTVRAHGQNIEYDADAGRLTLIGQAELLRQGERFAAEKIRYWLDSQRVQGGRGEDDAGERVRIRIEPDQDGAGEEGGAQDGEAGNGQDTTPEQP